MSKVCFTNYFLLFSTDLVKGQHHLLSAMVLHLRYPNAHTHWFSSLMLHLFLEVKEDRFKEVMAKVLLERFLVHRPHPWGALVTFIELLRNSKYEFWNQEFIRIAPEVALFLETVRILFCDVVPCLTRPFQVAKSVFQP